jgi:hypothetical protein
MKDSGRCAAGGAGSGAGWLAGKGPAFRKACEGGWKWAAAVTRQLLIIGAVTAAVLGAMPIASS